MRRVKFVSMFVLLALLLSARSGAVMADKETPPPPEDVPVIVVTKPSELPEDAWDEWPIERTETSEYVDENGWTHVERVTFRRAPASRWEPCPDALEGSPTAPTALCHLAGVDTKTNHVFAPGYAVQGHLETHAEVWAKPGALNHHKVLDSTLWWTRDNADWSVRNAQYRAGYFSSCVECDTGSFVQGRVFEAENSPFNPCWWNDTHSCVYIVDPWHPNWPRIYCSEWTPQNVNSPARVYHNSTDVGEVFVQTAWPD